MTQSLKDDLYEELTKQLAQLYMLYHDQMVEHRRKKILKLIERAQKEIQS